MGKLRINSVDIYKADIEFHEPFRIAIMEITGAQSLFIKINTNEELYGPRTWPSSCWAKTPWTLKTGCVRSTNI